ncbi:506_t:CDS:1 [Scutellospora calospora]|uniref:506_t:CDS:1 n=1 Tax=Scutellospora calospora TaxID=85575 RepID=A0ACA9KHS6_9GLOM|nr:506_t:CDS:1 [Scutellospora calospora]
MIDLKLSLDFYNEIIDTIIYEIFELDILYVKKPVKTIKGILYTCRYFYYYFRKKFAISFYKKFGLDEEIFSSECVRKDCKKRGHIRNEFFFNFLSLSLDIWNLVDIYGDRYCGSIWDLLNAYKNDIYERRDPYS